LHGGHTMTSTRNSIAWQKFPFNFHAHFPHVLAIAFVPFWLYWAIEPYDRAVWMVENTPVIVLYLLLLLTFHKFRFSDASYYVMALGLCWHTVGGHYTFERVPFDWVTDTFGFERNHYDRVGHFLAGAWAWPIAELMLRQGWITRTVPLMLFCLFSIMSVAASFEIAEWWYAAINGGESAVSYLGSQGDLWDAQKDMLADTLGAIIALLKFHLFCNRGLFSTS